jgi:drug/metabolite transporter (DMT)-like permease
MEQGWWLGLLAGGGMLLQNDGLQFTSVSVSSFLTQFYAIMIPFYFALQVRRWPSPLVLGCAALVFVGVAVLGRFDLQGMRIGRGEFETLLCSGFFMAQILLLESKRYAANRALPITLVMFVVEALLFSIVSGATAPQLSDLLIPWTNGPWLVFTGLLTVFCTLGSFILMNTWQPKITATEAGLIYCFEPIFASIMALFLPAIFAAWAGFTYMNEQLTWHLLLGGGLITLANVLLQLNPPAKT